MNAVKRDNLAEGCLAACPSAYFIDSVKYDSLLRIPTQLKATLLIYYQVFTFEPGYSLPCWYIGHEPCAASVEQRGQPVGH